MSNIDLSQEKVMQTPNKKKSRRSLLLVVAIFALPIILAKFALEQQWLDLGVTNEGSLLTDEMTLKQLGIINAKFDHQWLILYALPSDCSQHCEKALETVHNTYVALGKDMPRITPVALYQSDFSSEQMTQMKNSQWQLELMSSEAKQYIENSQVFIVDPLGNLFLSHQLPGKIDEFPQLGKQILADMKKVLKYSKVG